MLSKEDLSGYHRDESAIKDHLVFFAGLCNVKLVKRELSTLRGKGILDYRYSVKDGVLELECDLEDRCSL